MFVCVGASLQAERRGALFDKRKCSYLFDLNRDMVIDAMWRGDKLRFANHSDKHPNCKTKVIMSGGA
jgi:SET domain-containing protein